METPGAQAEAVHSVTPEAVAELVNEQVAEHISPLTEKLDAITQTLNKPAEEHEYPKDKFPWEVDPTYAVKTTPELFGWIEQYAKAKGIGQVDTEDVVNKVLGRLQEQQQKTVEETKTAQEYLDQEVAEVKAQNPKLKEQDVFKFIGEWNSTHTSPIISFKDGAEMYALAGKKPVEEAKPTIPGMPTNMDEDTQAAKPSMLFRSVQEAQRYAAQLLEEKS